MKFNDSWWLTRQTFTSKKYHAPSLENTIMDLLTDFETVAEKSCHTFFGIQSWFSSFMADTGCLMVWMTLILLSMFTQIKWTVVCTQNIISSTLVYLWCDALNNTFDINNKIHIFLSWNKPLDTTQLKLIMKVHECSWIFMEVHG